MAREDAFRYDKMVENALRGVVRQALDEVVAEGLVDDHHFYITFFTSFPGVELPSYLRERYPGEMTIVLQHQFYDLEVDEERFTVMLSFNNVPERLTIPLAAITIFADPSVNFALQFQPLIDEEDADIAFESEEMDMDEPDEEETTGEVISLDSFRTHKKKKKAKKVDADDSAEDTGGDKRSGKKEKDTKEAKESKDTKDSKDAKEDDKKSKNSKASKKGKDKDDKDNKDK